MKIRDLLTKVNGKLRPAHVDGHEHDVDEAFAVGKATGNASFVPSQQDERPGH